MPIFRERPLRGISISLIRQSFPTKINCGHSESVSVLSLFFIPITSIFYQMEMNPDLKCHHNLLPRIYTSNKKHPGRYDNITPALLISQSPDSSIAAQNQLASSAVSSVSLTYIVDCPFTVPKYLVWLDEAIPSPSQNRVLPPTPQSAQASGSTLHEPPSTPTPLSRKRTSPDDMLGPATVSLQFQKRAKHGDEAEDVEVSKINSML